MKFVNPSYEILEMPVNALKSIELAARTCYKSEDKISEDGESAKSLASGIIKRKHEARDLADSPSSLILSSDL